MANRRILAEIWDRHMLPVPHSSPLSRHRTVEAAVAAAARANKRPGIEGDPYIVLFLENGAYLPLRSWKPALQVTGETGWHHNSLRFATRCEAEKSALDIWTRWMAATNHDAHPSTDEPNYVWVDSGRSVPLTTASPQEVK